MAEGRATQQEEHGDKRQSAGPETNRADALLLLLTPRPFRFNGEGPLRV
jgi:hypothetical protein